MATYKVLYINENGRRNYIYVDDISKESIYAHLGYVPLIMELIGMKEVRDYE